MITVGLGMVRDPIMGNGGILPQEVIWTKLPLGSLMGRVTTAESGGTEQQTAQSLKEQVREDK